MQLAISEKVKEILQKNLGGTVFWSGERTGGRSFRKPVTYLTDDLMEVVGIR